MNCFTAKRCCSVETYYASIYIGINMMQSGSALIKELYNLYRLSYTVHKGVLYLVYINT